VPRDTRRASCRRRATARRSRVAAPAARALSAPRGAWAREVAGHDMAWL